MITYDRLVEIIRGKLIDHSMDVSYESLSEEIFGEGNCFNETEVRKRMYGMKRMLEVIQNSGLGDGMPHAANRILAISDFHVPFNLPVSRFEKYAGVVDTLVLNGDIEDCQSVSKFPKMYRVDFVDEMLATRELLMELIDTIRPKKVVITMGNHEKRLGRYLSDALNPDLMSIMPSTPMDLILRDGFRKHDRINRSSTWYDPLMQVYDSKVDIVYTGDWHIKVGKTIFCHPMAYMSGILKTTEKAVNFFLRGDDRDFDCICMGHTHRLGSYVQGGITMYEQGCWCDLSKLDYADGRLAMPAQNGYVYMVQDADGNLIHDQTKLVSC